MQGVKYILNQHPIYSVEGVSSPRVLLHRMPSLPSYIDVLVPEGELLPAKITIKFHSIGTPDYPLVIIRGEFGVSYVDCSVEGRIEGFCSANEAQMETPLFLPLYPGIKLTGAAGRSAKEKTPKDAIFVLI